MADKHRWTDPANVGQPDYIKVGVRVFFLMMLLVLAAVLKIAIKNQWFDSLRDIIGI